MFFVMMFQKLKAATDVFDWMTLKIYFEVKILFAFCDKYKVLNEIKQCLFHPIIFDVCRMEEKICLLHFQLKNDLKYLQTMLEINLLVKSSTFSTKVSSLFQILVCSPHFLASLENKDKRKGLINFLHQISTYYHVQFPKSTTFTLISILQTGTFDLGEEEILTIIKTMNQQENKIWTHFYPLWMNENFDKISKSNCKVYFKQFLRFKENQKLKPQDIQVFNLFLTEFSKNINFYEKEINSILNLSKQLNYFNFKVFKNLFMFYKHGSVRMKEKSFEILSEFYFGKKLEIKKVTEKVNLKNFPWRSLQNDVTLVNSLIIILKSLEDVSEKDLIDRIAMEVINILLSTNTSSKKVIKDLITIEHESISDFSVSSLYFDTINVTKTLHK
jgi:hypothetical protein